MKTWLIYPPFADPTQPYLSLPYLKGCLRARGRDATVVDLNVEAAHHLLGRDFIYGCAERIAVHFSRLNHQKTLSRHEQMAYLALADARQAALRWLQAHTQPVKIFQDPDRFYDFRTYRRARHLAEDAMTCAGAAAFPYNFHFNRAAHAVLPWGTRLLSRYFQERHSPLDRFYRDFIRNSGIRTGDVVGLNLTFISQIPEVFYLVQLLRRMVPDLFIVLGGSCLQQILAHAGESARRWIVTIADAACLFEAEQTLALLLEALGEQWCRSDPGVRHRRLRDVPNLLSLDPEGRLHHGPVAITDLKSLPVPDYSDLDLDRYLAPERTLLYAPTRGCYWNRCAFCDYGLNRTQCHGYREMAADEAARQLRALSVQYGVRNFYLSVDVMAPKFAEALAAALLENKADIRWSADFRIEKYYTPARCSRLFQSGLRAVAFGVESGCDRMLRQMDKGITVEMVRQVNRCFHQAGIATAWMTFSHHPRERAQDALGTVRLIVRQRSVVDLFILGRFGLTSGSDIAARPEQYGLTRVFYCRGDDFRLFPLFEDRQPLSPRDEQRLEEAVARLSRGYCLDHYPWAGAISTHHTLLYILKHGQGIFKHLGDQPSISARGGHQSLSPDLAGLWQRPRHHLGRLRQRQAQFMERFWQLALTDDGSGWAPLDEDYFNASFSV